MGNEELVCGECGHREWWEPGNYFGERVDFEHHSCGHPGEYEPCGPNCNHEYPGAGKSR
jgi:hypothetical protein